MGHYCRFCGRIRPNQKFSGKGHKTHVCKDCSRLPRVERQRIDIRDELFGFLRQSRISVINCKRLTELTGHENPEISKIAGLLLQVARIAEGKRRRWKRVREADAALYLQCREAELMFYPYGAIESAEYDFHDSEE